MTALAHTLVTKGVYAAMKGRAPSAVSNWIAEGRISAAAVIGVGQRAQIWVEQADADLARNLDPSKQGVLDNPINQSLPPPPGEDPAPPTAPPVASLVDDDIRRKRKADADQAELNADRARRQAEADAGRWMETVAATLAWEKQLRSVIGTLEQFIQNRLAQDIADEFQIDWKRVSVIARSSFREVRTQIADQAAGVTLIEVQEAAE